MYRVYLDRLSDQRKVMQREMNISAEQFRSDSLLYRKEVLSAVDYRNSESNLLDKKYSFHGVMTSLAEIETEMLALER
jgi:HlyD family secretion protein